MNNFIKKHIFMKSLSASKVLSIKIIFVHIFFFLVPCRSVSILRKKDYVLYYPPLPSQLSMRPLTEQTRNACWFMSANFSGNKLFELNWNAIALRKSCAPYLASIGLFTSAVSTVTKELVNHIDLR